jgi:hypothetical protein
MEEKIYSWFVKKGNILIHRNGDCITFQLNGENEDFCWLTKSDTDEVIDILTMIAKQIWENPDYLRKPYTDRLYKITEEGFYVWEIGDSQLLVKYDEIEGTIKIKSIGNANLNIEVNQAVEIIQILEQINNQI